jgi:hypothetical protein
MCPGRAPLADKYAKRVKFIQYKCGSLRYDVVN